MFAAVSHAVDLLTPSGGIESESLSVVLLRFGTGLLFITAMRKVPTKLVSDAAAFNRFSQDRMDQQRIPVARAQVITGLHFETRHSKPGKH
jgi:hypothetical protein